MIVEEMLQELISFLSKYGNMPSIKKSADERILDAERRLYNRMIDLQMGLETRFLEELKSRGYYPSDKEEQMRMLNEVFGVPFEEMKIATSDIALNTAEIIRQLTFEDIERKGYKVEFVPFKSHEKDYLWNKIYTFSSSSFNAIIGDFSMTLTKGYLDGLGIDEVAVLLRDDFKNLRDYRLRNIARTEIQTAQNYGTYETLKEYRLNYKQWITVDDTRVRHSHAILHGEVVKTDERFSNGLLYPGEREGPIEEWVNCRCRIVPYIPRSNELILTTPYYP